MKNQSGPRAVDKEVVFRADAAFAKPEVYEAPEQRDVKYAIRIPANDSLVREIAELLPVGRRVGRPSQKPLVEYKAFLYQAASWKTARRVVATVEHHAGELFPRVGFIVANLTLPSRASDFGPPAAPTPERPHPNPAAIPGTFRLLIHGR